MAQRFGLLEVMDSLPEPAAGHAPAPVAGRGDGAQAGAADPGRADLGVDPVARDLFWRLMIELSRATGDHLHLHPLHERGRALRPHLADARRPVLVSDTPAALIASAAATLEEAFIAYLEEAAGKGATPRRKPSRTAPDRPAGASACAPAWAAR
jgi:ribosome-dependent ATPase